MNWAYTQRILDRQPLDGMNGPPQAGVRLHAPVDHVRANLNLAQHQVTVAAASTDGGRAGRARLHRAEQVLLPTRLAADSGARRGKLAALRLTDLDGDVLTIARATSSEVAGRTKSGRIRRLTLGPTTATCGAPALTGAATVRRRYVRAVGILRGPNHGTRLATSILGNGFRYYVDRRVIPT